MRARGAALRGALSPRARLALPRMARGIFLRWPRTRWGLPDHTPRPRRSHEEGLLWVRGAVAVLEAEFAQAARAPGKRVARQSPA